MVDRFGFIGVTATRSSINRVFPRWAEELGLGEVEFVPLDLPLNTAPATYRQVVTDIHRDPDHRGALVTSHKVRLLDATGDHFDELDHYARLAGEISCISKRAGRLRGHAKDPITAGYALEDFLPRGHFAGDAEVLCLGAGGSGLAISIHFASRPAPEDRPARITLVSRTRTRVEVCHTVLGHLDGKGPAVPVEYVVNEDPAINDELLAALPAGSLVINATGMGKDRPGSPLTDRARFPEHGFAWELNYRGELDFLHQARARAEDRDLTVEDGWRYFVYGWSEVVDEAFDLGLDRDTVARLGAIAAAVRT